MKGLTPAVMFSVAFVASSLVARPAQGGHFVHGYYGHPHYYRGGGFASFGFYGGCYAPPPVYFVPPPPVVYYAPPAVVAAPPVIVQQPPVVVQQPPAVEQQAPAVEQTPAEAQPAPRFVETARRYHEHGDNAGRIDWVEGLMDGRPMRIYYDDFGRVKKQKWIDD